MESQGIGNDFLSSRRKFCSFGWFLARNGVFHRENQQPRLESIANPLRIRPRGTSKLGAPQLCGTFSKNPKIALQNLDLQGDPQQFMIFFWKITEFNDLFTCCPQNHRFHTKKLFKTQMPQKGSNGETPFRCRRRTSKVCHQYPLMHGSRI